MTVFLVMVMKFDLLNSIFRPFVLMQSIEILVLPFVNDRPMSVIQHDPLLGNAARLYPTISCGSDSITRQFISINSALDR